MHTTIHKLRLLASLACLSLAFLLLSCGGDDDENISFGPVKFGEYESRIEVPEMLKSGTQFIYHDTQENGHKVLAYCLEYDLGRLHSRWVAFRFDGDTRKLGASRSDAWKDDPKLDSKYKIGPGTFHGGYVRGHICASYDRRYSAEAESETFCMTNMTPMYYDFNGEYWTIFENYIQTKGRDTKFADTLYVVKGGTIYDSNKIIGTCTTSAGKKTVVPRYYYIAALKRNGDSYCGIGFWVEQSEHPSTKGMNNNEILRTHSMNIDELEERTGINFFCHLPDKKEQEMEREDIESIRRTWGL